MHKHIARMRPCERCDKDVMARLVRNITASGVSQVYWLCTEGNHPIKKNGAFILHEKVRTVVYPDELPVIENYSGREVCAVCGNPFTEEHHWAPRHLFGAEAEQWPKAYLCKRHHIRWHSLVTPHMAEVKT